MNPPITAPLKYYGLSDIFLRGCQKDWCCNI
jgi:hypothetical protein